MGAVEEMPDMVSREYGFHFGNIGIFRKWKSWIVFAVQMLFIGRKIKRMYQQQLAQIAIVVRDYDEAIQFYTQVLSFTLIEDTVMSETKRWVKVMPQGSNGCAILLAKAANAEQESRIGNQTGGRVFLFLHTTDFEADYARLLLHKVEIVREPVEEAWGKVCVFADLYGNLWDLIQPNV